MTKGLKSVVPGLGKGIKIFDDELDDSIMLRLPGNTYYVDADAGVDAVTYDGLSWRHPFASITYALSKCVSGRGDTIVVKAGSYVENIVISKDNVTLVGAFQGYGRPDVVPASGLAIDVAGQGFVAVRMRFACPAVNQDNTRIEANGGKYVDCVFDGSSTQGVTKANLRLKGKTDDDSYTASENLFQDCLFRGAGGFGVAFDVGDGAGNQVGCTDNRFVHCFWQNNVKEDLIAVDTSLGGAYSMKNNFFERCFFGLGASKNKATHIDNKTTHGATNTGNTWNDCFINDDTPDTTALKTDGTSSSFIGCSNLDGIINGDTID